MMDARADAGGGAMEARVGSRTPGVRFTVAYDEDDLGRGRGTSVGGGGVME